VTPAERLLAAADLLEKRAGDAISDWRVDDNNHLGLASVTTPSRWRPDGPRYSFTGPDDETTRYIATVHPEVGKALASTLRDGVALLATDPVWCGTHLLPLADLLLAGAS